MEVEQLDLTVDKILRPRSRSLSSGFHEKDPHSVSSGYTSGSFSGTSGVASANVKTGAHSQTSSDSESNVPRGASRSRSKTLRPYSDPDTVFSRPHSRSKCGKRGVAVPLFGNFYTIKKTEDWSLYHYRVKFSPEESQPRIRKILFRNVAMAQEIGYIFDGTQLFTPKPFTHENDQVLAVGDAVEFKVPAYTNKDKPDEETYDCTIKIVLEQKLSPGSPACNQVQNILANKCLRYLGLEKHGRHYYDPEEAIVFEKDHLEVWPGYVTSMRAHEKGSLFCVELTYLVVHLETLLQTINLVIRARKCEKNEGRKSTVVSTELQDAMVLTKYNRKTYRVIEVNFRLNPGCTFELKDGVTTTYAEYYKSKYGLEVKLDQPLILAKSDQRPDAEPVMLVPEICHLTGLDSNMRTDFLLMKTLKEHRNPSPKQRVEKVENFMEQIFNNGIIIQLFHKWGLEFSKGLVDFVGRVIPSEKLLLAENIEPLPVGPTGSVLVASRTKHMRSTVELKSWVLIVPKRNAMEVTPLISAMTKVASPMNMCIKPPKEVVEVEEFSAQAYLNALNEVLKKHYMYQLVFVVLPNRSLELYSTVKKRLSIQAGMPSQCLLSNNLRCKERLMNIATHLTVQLNAKLGGVPWSVKMPLKNTMFVGFDVYLGSKEMKGQNVCAMVATVSPEFTKYFSLSSKYQTTDQLCRHMRADINKCVLAFQEENAGELPESIIMYREGVGHDQLKYVYEEEIAHIQKELAHMYKNKPKPKLTYMVVSRRINTKLLTVEAEMGGFENPPPGTVADSTVTRPERYDFLLISSAARKGTVSPCSYNVLIDDNNFTPDRIQQITYKLCHLYYNWSGTIAVPAICQYARKLAFLSATAFSGAYANRKLNKLLHFL